MENTLKPILLNALVSRQIDHDLAYAIAAAAGVDLTEVIDPVRTAENLLLIGQQLLQKGVIDSTSTYDYVASSILGHIDQFEIA